MIAVVNAFRLMIVVIVLAVVIGSIMVTSAGDARITINSPSDDDMVSTKTITVSGTVVGDQGAVIESVTVNDDPALGTGPEGGFSSWEIKKISLQEGQNEITVEVTDIFGDKTPKIITVFYNAPTPPPTPTPMPTLPPKPTPIATPKPTPIATPKPTPIATPIATPTPTVPSTSPSKPTLTPTPPPETGDISIHTNIESATFTISGPVPFSESGILCLERDAPAGTYTIIYQDVSGYNTPISETKTLSAGGLITFTGKYEKHEVEWRENPGVFIPILLTAIIAIGSIVTILGNLGKFKALFRGRGR